MAASDKKHYVIEQWKEDVQAKMGCLQISLASTGCPVQLACCCRYCNEYWSANICMPFMSVNHLSPHQIFFFCLFFQGCTHGIWRFPVSRIGVKSELQPLVYATAMQDLSCLCDLHHSSWQHWMLKPLSEARDKTHVLKDTSWVR